MRLLERYGVLCGLDDGQLHTRMEEGWRGTSQARISRISPAILRLRSWNKPMKQLYLATILNGNDAESPRLSGQGQNRISLIPGFRRVLPGENGLRPLQVVQLGQNAATLHLGSLENLGENYRRPLWELLDDEMSQSS
ncbi:hypothetical protein Landi51_03402 [Colletotrichum acutatum]